MKQLFNFLLLFLLCSCASDKARESTQADDDTVKTAVTYFDKEFFNIKGPVKTLSLSISGSEYGKQEVAFDRNGKIVSWYIDGNPVVFERDSNQRIVKYTKQYFASYDEIYEIEPRVITQTTTYFYDDEGRVSKKEDMWDTAVGKDSEKYLTYNDEGAPTKVERHTSGEGAGSYNYTYTYSDNDSHGNWLKVKKAGPYDTEINKRVITYYTDSDNDSFAEKKQKEFEQAIANQSSELNKKVAANMKEYKQVLAERETEGGEEYYGDSQYHDLRETQQSQSDYQQYQQDIAIIDYLEQIEGEVERMKPSLNEAMAKYNAAKARYGATDMETGIPRDRVRNIISDIASLYRRAMNNAREINDSKVRQQLYSRYEQLYNKYNGLSNRIHAESMPH